jgi:hypothetical protein
LRRLLQHFDEPATSSKTVRGVWFSAAREDC